MENVAIISILCTILGAAIGYLTYKRNYSNDIKKDAENRSIIATKLDYIWKGVDDIRLDIKNQDRMIRDLSERVIKVEESNKSAHKRIDEIGRDN